MKKVIFLVLILVMTSSCLVSAQDNKIWYGRNESNPSQMIPVLLTSEGVLRTDMNFSVADIWNTNIGQLTDANDTQFNNIGSALTIDTSWLETLNDNTYFRLDGTSTMQGNTNMGGFNLLDVESIIFSLGEVLDNIVDGWIRITGGLNVTEDLTIGGNITATGIQNQLMPNLWTCQLTQTSNPIITSNLTKSIEDGKC